MAKLVEWEWDESVKASPIGIWTGGLFTNPDWNSNWKFKKWSLEKRVELE